MRKDSHGIHAACLGFSRGGGKRGGVTLPHFIGRREGREGPFVSAFPAFPYAYELKPLLTPLFLPSSLQTITAPSRDAQRGLPSLSGGQPEKVCRARYVGACS